MAAATRPYERTEAYLDKYLSSLKNKEGKYKRVCLSPLRYAGGKSKAVGMILENMPKHTKGEIPAEQAGCRWRLTSLAAARL